MYLAEHRGSTDWGDRKSNRHKSNQIKSWFLVRGENRSTRGKTSRSREENQQTQHAYDVRPGNRTRGTLVEGQCSHLCANTAPYLLAIHYTKSYHCTSIFCSFFARDITSATYVRIVLCATCIPHLCMTSIKQR